MSRKVFQICRWPHEEISVVSLVCLYVPIDIRYSLFYPGFGKCPTGNITYSLLCDVGNAFQLCLGYGCVVAHFRLDISWYHALGCDLHCLVDRQNEQGSKKVRRISMCMLRCNEQYVDNGCILLSQATYSIKRLQYDIAPGLATQPYRQARRSPPNVGACLIFIWSMRCDFMCWDHSPRSSSVTPTDPTLSLWWQTVPPLRTRTNW